jgi:hypothetical protein
MMDEAPSAAQPTPAPPSAPPRWLPRIGSPAYHVMLSAVAILILGPLGGISAAFMNFSIGFYVGGQVLAGILGSAVTLPYGPEGKHGANYMQTMAASVAGMCGCRPWCRRWSGWACRSRPPGKWSFISCASGCSASAWGCFTRPSWWTACN